LFTRALKGHDLSPDDREFAYLNRGKAYLGKGDTTDASADLRKALALKPDDADAQSALAQASNGPPRATADQSAEPPASGGRFGVIVGMVDRYYWYQIAGANPHIAVAHVEWVKRDQILSFTLRSKAGLAQAGEYIFDDASGKLLSAGVSSSGGGNIISYGTVDTLRASSIGYGYSKGVPIRDTLSQAADGSFREHEQKFENGQWHDAADVLFVELLEAEAEAQGFVKHK